jgi:hypothetical protein
MIDLASRAARPDIPNEGSHLTSASTAPPQLTGKA